MLIQFLREIIFCCKISMLGLSWVKSNCELQTQFSQSYLYFFKIFFVNAGPCFSMPKNSIMCPSTLILLGINAMYMSTQRWISFLIPQMFRIWGLESLSSDCTFNVHINSLSKRCKNLTGWILRTFILVIN